MTSGRLAFDGPVNDAITQYRRVLATADWSEDPVSAHGPHGMTINGELNPEVIECAPNLPLRVDLAVERLPGAAEVDVTLNLVVETPDGRTALHLRNDLDRTALRVGPGSTVLTVVIEDLSLAPGNYVLWLRLVGVDARDPLMLDTRRVLLIVTGEQATGSVVLPRHHFEQRSPAPLGLGTLTGDSK
jgi:hypothetical protein